MTTDAKNINKFRIYEALMPFFNSNSYAVYGMLGNIEAESGFNPENVQDIYEARLGMSDRAYTDAVNEGKYKNFCNDGAGYGLCQWTWWKRKEGLLNLARECKCSIGSLDIQCDYIKVEMCGEYAGLKRLLDSVTSPGEAARLIMLHYEKPFDQSEANLARRAALAEKIMDEMSGGNESPMLYTVRKGDTLWALSRKFGVTINSIVAANKEGHPRIRPEYIEAGWILKIPCSQ